MYRAPNTQLIELIIPATAGANSTIYFQNQPQLQSVVGDKKIFIEAIEVFSSLSISGSPLTSGSPAATPAQLLNGTLVLNVAGTLQFQFLPLNALNRMWVDPSTAGAADNNVHAKDLFMFESLYQVDWTKSYVQLINAPAGAPYSYLFNVYYRWDILGA